MLTNCPECQLQVSENASFCPHCGYLFRPGASPKPRKKKRRRLPNGFGQITELKKRNLRNRFRVMVTVGKTSTGRPIAKLLKPESYFPTYNDAYQALVEYNRNPYDLDVSISVAELYEKWTEEYFKTLKSESSARTITAAWAYCSSVYDMRASDIRARHVKGCMEEGIAIIKGEERKASANTKSRIKSLFNLMLDYALEYEIVDRNYARTFDISDDVLDEIDEAKRGHIPFTEEEMEILWNNIDIKLYVDVIIFQCYSGWRPQELGLLKLENIDWEQGIIVGGMKSDAGRNRVVPIHPKIRHIVERKYKEAVELGSEYLLNCTDSKKGIKLTYDKYQKRYMKIIDELKLNDQHRAHDPRNHFTTMAKKYHLDEYAIKYIVGHAIQDITERVYTKREIEWLVEEMKKIK